MLLQALEQVRDLLEPGDSAHSSTNERHNEQHHQNSDTDLNDLELGLEQVEATDADQAAEQLGTEAPLPDCKLPNLPLRLVLTACQEIQAYTRNPIRHWHQLVQTAEVVRPMMGISPSAWEDAKMAMGSEQAAVVIAFLLERFNEIKSPGGYLRKLTQHAEMKKFSCGPMIMALVRKAA